MAEGSLKKKAVRGVLWRVIETIGNQGIQFVISIVLARLILPEQFAAIAMLSIFFAVAQVFINSGFSQALLRTTNRTQVDCCSVFYFNIGVSIISYLLLFITAPLIAEFYSLPVLKSLLRVSALSLIIGSFSAVHRTLYDARLEFNSLTKYNLSAQIVAGCFGIVMAYHNFQAWALVAQSLMGTFFSTCLIWYFSPWHPTWDFSWKSIKTFFGFGSKLVASNLLNSVYNNMYSVIIGKCFPHSDLAFYNRAQGLTQFASSTPSIILQSVTYPVLCKVKDNNDQLRNGYRSMLQVSAFVIFPIALGLGAVSYPLINVLYTSKWIYTAPLLQIIVFSGMWYPIHSINLNLLIVKGESGLFFKLEIIKKVIGVIMLCVTVPFGLKAMCYGGVVSSIISLIINTHYTGKFLKLGFIEQMSDIWPSLLLSIFMYMGCKTLSTALGNGILSLSVSIITGIIIYAGGAYIFKFREFEMLKNIRR